MDIYDEAFLDLWRCFNEHKVRYILVGGIATNLHGYQRYTGDVDIFIDDATANRKRLREAYKEYINLDLQSLETMQFIPGWINFPLSNGSKLDIMTSMKGIAASFDDCFAVATEMDLNGVKVPVLHMAHLIANKKAVGRPKDQLDVINLEKIQRLRDEEN